MNNIKRIVDALITWKGERVVIGTSEPVYIFKENKKIPLLKKELSEREYYLLMQELSAFSGGSQRLVVQDRELLIQDEGMLVQISLLPDGHGQATVEKTMPAVSEMPEPRPDPIADQKEKKEAEETDADRIRALVSQFNTDTIEGILSLMVKMKASDLHLGSDNNPYFRIDGEMRAIEAILPVCSEELWERLLAIMPKRNQEEFLALKDTDFAYEIEGYGRYRSNVFQDQHGIGAVFRLIPSEILTVDKLQVPEVILELCKMPKGLLLVTGPTGSGKSTTLASLIDHINRTQRKHIITIEDPVEFVHRNQLSLINQREVHTHTESFKKALRAALREDPDIILVGEMRDLETIAIAIEMAVTGHLVLGTLHTSTAVSTVDRIIDQFPPDRQAQIRTMLADALIGVISQMLLKKIVGGRIAAYEVMVANIAVSNLIREGKTYQISTIMQTGKKMGQQMLNAHLSQLVNEGTVTAEEALDKAIDKENLKALIKAVTERNPSNSVMKC